MPHLGGTTTSPSATTSPAGAVDLPFAVGISFGGGVPAPLPLPLPAISCFGGGCRELELAAGDPELALQGLGGKGGSLGTLSAPGGVTGGASGTSAAPCGSFGLRSCDLDFLLFLALFLPFSSSFLILFLPRLRLRRAGSLSAVTLPSSSNLLGMPD